MQLGQWISFGYPAFNNDDGIETNEGKPAGLVVFLSRFEQETGLPIVNLGKGGDRSFDVGDKIDPQGDEVSALREAAEFVARWSNGVME